jgi:hypothetical protein
MLANQ